MSSFHLLNFGCRSSQADGSALKEELRQAGLEESSTIEESQFAILNTCTVTAAADAEVRQLVRRIRRRNPLCRILVTGCYAQRAPEEIARLGGVEWVVGNSHKHLVKALLAAENLESGDREIGRSGEQAAAQDAPLVRIQAAPARQTSDLGPRTWDSARVLVGEITADFHFAPVYPHDRTRPTLKIQDGCNARCSFCVIPFVRGQSRSLEPEKVVAEAQRLQEEGFKEVVLSGINLGSYGRDLDRSITFLGILERMLAETSIPRFRISSIELMDVSPSLIRLVAREPRMAKHLHVPLQSGCDRILRAMNRRYWSRHYAERILAIHEQMPNGAIGADVMVGFPGETDRDHAASLNFIESLPFTYLHIFPFSARPGTPAAESRAQVDGRVARERSNEIRAVIAAKREAFLASQAGRTLPAISLDETEADARVALTTNYLEVRLPGSDLPGNRLVDVRVDGVGPHGLIGSPHPEATT